MMLGINASHIMELIYEWFLLLLLGKFLLDILCFDCHLLVASCQSKDCMQHMPLAAHAFLGAELHFYTETSDDP